MNKKTIKELKNLDKKVVLLRVDFNVPIENKKIQDNARIISSLPTIEYLINKNSKIVIFSHLGRIEKEEDKKNLSLKPISKELKKLSKFKVKFINETRGQKLENAIKKMKPKSIIIVENTRFEDFKDGKSVKLESNNDKDLSKYWASLGDVFVNDAFGAAHRKHASNVGIAQNSKESCIGFLIEKEIKYLYETINNPKRPFVAILGGKKVSDKINVIESLLKKADKVIIGPAMVYTFSYAMGKKVGSSLVEKDKVDLAKRLINEFKDKIVLSFDSVCLDTFEDKPGHIYEEIPEGMTGMDIGPKSVEFIKEELKNAKTVFWNGPFGVFEFENFKKGSQEIANYLANLKNAKTIIGGGDSASMVIQMGLKNKFSHISTGGGASMKFLEGDELIGIKYINKSTRSNK